MTALSQEQAAELQAAYAAARMRRWAELPNLLMPFREKAEGESAEDPTA